MRNSVAAVCLLSSMTLASAAFAMNGAATIEMAEQAVRAGSVYKVTLHQFPVGQPTWTPAMLFTPAIESNTVKIYSTNCEADIAAFAKTNVPAYGGFTLNPMTFKGESVWTYPTSPIRAIQVLFTLKSVTPVLACDLVIEPQAPIVPTTPTPTNGDECLSLSEARQLQQCQAQQLTTLECDILSVRYRKFGLCQ